MRMVRLNLPVTLYILVGIVLRFTSSVPSSCYLRFRPVNNRYDLRYADYFSPAKKNTWYAGAPIHQKRVIFSDEEGSPVDIDFDCQVDTIGYLSGKITSMRLCSNRDLNSKESRNSCRAFKGSGHIQLNSLFAGDIGTGVTTADVSYDPMNGAFIRATLSMRREKSLHVWCEAENAFGMVKSNILQLIDMRYSYSKKKAPRNWNKLKINSPNSIPCEGANIRLPSDVDKLIPHAYQWTYCFGKDVNKACKSIKDVETYNERLTIPAQVFDNGTLFFPYFDDLSQRILEGATLRCKVANWRVEYHDKPFKFIMDPNPLPINDLTVLGPNSRVDGGLKKPIFLVADDPSELRFHCNYIVGSGDYLISWYHTHKGNKVTLAKDITGKAKRNQYFYNSQFGVTIHSNTIIFKGPYKWETAGTYTCEVEWISHSRKIKKSDSVQVEVKYDVLKTPLYVLNGGGTTFQCRDAGPSSKTEILINGYDHYRSSGSSAETTWDKQMDNLRSWLFARTGAFDFHLSDERNTKFSIRRIHFRDDRGISTTHQMQCYEISSDFPDVAVSIYNRIVQVIPKPRISTTKNPSKFQCTSVKSCYLKCLSHIDHFIYCDIENDGDYSDSIFEGKLKYEWLVDGNPVHEAPELRRYLAPHGSVLRVVGTFDKNIIDLINSITRIECNVKVTYKPGELDPSEPDMDDAIYEGVKDPSAVSLLTTAIRLFHPTSEDLEMIKTNTKPESLCHWEKKNRGAPEGDNWFLNILLSSLGQKVKKKM